MRICAVVLVALSLTCPAQSLDRRKPDAMSILSEASRHYSEVESYHIEAVEENETSSLELSRSWQKTLLTAIVAPGGRYHYEGHSAFGSAIAISDGNTAWDYHLTSRVYRRRPATGQVFDRHRIISQESAPLLTATQLRDNLVRMASRIKSATRLRDQTIVVGGRRYRAYVLHYGTDDLRTRRREVTEEETIWVDKSRGIVLKTAHKGQSYMLISESGAHIPLFVQTTTVYPVVDLNQNEPAESFAFAVPPDTKRVDAFVEPTTTRFESAASSFLDKPAPELQLKASDGTLQLLSAFRGKPVFIDFWATWCAACVESIPDLTKLYQQTRAAGLVWLSIDSDEDPAAARALISEQHVPWPNYHDTEGTLGKTFQRGGIPLGVLLRADGTVAFYESGYEVPELRNAVSKLGPEFSFVAESPPTAK